MVDAIRTATSREHYISIRRAGVSATTSSIFDRPQLNRPAAIRRGVEARVQIRVLLWKQMWGQNAGPSRGSTRCRPAA